MIEAPSGTFGTGKSRDVLLATQTLPFESRARARTLIPARKVSALVGSSAGNRTTCVGLGIADPDAILRHR